MSIFAVAADGISFTAVQVWGILIAFAGLTVWLIKIVSNTRETLALYGRRIDETEEDVNALRQRSHEILNALNYLNLQVALIRQKLGVKPPAEN